MNLYKLSLLLLTLSLFIFNSAFPQGGTWTWISGDSAVGSLGVFGTQGVPSVNNHPPGSYEACEWKDKQGNFWIFDAGTIGTPYSDLWKYDPLTNEWTWVKGNGQLGQLPIYGIQGVPNPLNTPGGRGWGIVTWTDISGTLWLFGGFTNHGFQYKNDLWKYDISSNQWTWMKGDSTANGVGVYGTQGTPSPTNTPDSRAETCSAWTDSLNNLWLFGGLDISRNYLSDLWKYDISTNEWTWMKGFQSQPANYGIIGIANANNNPGGRMTYTKWKDEHGNFWLMGGSSGSLTNLNDIWKYDLSINEWIWMSGPNVVNDSGNYQSKCLFNAIHLPYSRYEQRASVTDNCGRFWLFGGRHYAYLNDVFFNDLWVFDSQQLKWNWLSGTNTPNEYGNYGILGVASPTNMPASVQGAVAWWGNDNKFYLFGGDGQLGLISAVWVFNPDTNCVSVCASVAAGLPIADFQSNKTNLCAYDCINFTDLSTNNPVNWEWLFSGAIDSTSTAQNPQVICYQSAGIYNVTLIATNAAGSDTVMFNNYITVSPAPPTPVITQIGTTLYCSTNPSYTSYQWYLDSVLIPGATDTSLVITQGGNYNVQVTNSNNCKIAVGINIVLGIQNYMNDNLITLYPNPTTNQLSITGNWQSQTGKATLTIFNTLGEQIYTQEINSKPSTVNCKSFPSGIYFLQLLNEKERWVGRFVKE